MAQMSDTPEKWAVNVPAVMQELGIDGPAPDFATREAKIAEALGLKDMLDLQFKNREAARQDRVANANIAQSYAAADASRVAAENARRSAATNGGYPAGYREPPDGIQGKDYKVIEGYSQNADAAANIASVYSAAKDALNQNMTGPGAGVKRTVASVVGLLPNLGVEEFLTGENRTQNIINTYDAVDQASKMQGIEALKGIGGSDTERELLTAIQTGVNNDALPEENRRRVSNQFAAATILSKKAQLASEWVNRFGSLQYAAPDGTTWQKYWPQYQRDNWAAHLKAEADKERLKRERAKGGGAPSAVDAASEIIARTRGPNNGR